LARWTLKRLVNSAGIFAPWLTVSQRLSRLTLGMERALDDLPDEEDGARWLERAVALLSAPSDANLPRVVAEVPARAGAIILLGPSLGDASGTQPQTVPN